MKVNVADYPFNVDYGLQRMIRGPILILILSLMASVTTIAQQRKIDSLRSLVPETDMERTDIFYELAYEYVDLNNALGAEYGKRSFQFAKRVGDSLRMVKAGRITVLAFSRLEKLDSAIILGLEILPVASRNHYTKQAKQILRTIALAYAYKANYDLGLRYNFELLKITAQDNDSLEMRHAFNNIGLIYYKLYNSQKALEYYHKAVSVKPPSDKYPLTTTFLNISLCYSVLKDFPMASEFLKKGFDTCQPECQPANMMVALQACGEFHFRKGNLDSAMVYYSKSYSLARELSNTRFQLDNVLTITRICFQRNQNSLGIQYLSEAESIMEQAPFGYELTRIYYRFSSFYKNIGDERKQAFYQGKCILLMDSIYSQKLINNLMKIESDYLERANKAKITEQEQLLKLKDQVIWRQNALNILIGVITLLLIALLYILYRSHRQRKSANRLLDLKVKERTAALESNHLALKHSFEESDVAISRSFLNIKSSTATIKGLCSLGLEDGNDIESRKCLLKISAVAQEVSLTLSRIPEGQKRNGLVV